jgi:O-antigen ligase
MSERPGLGWQIGASVLAVGLGVMAGVRPVLAIVAIVGAVVLAAVISSIAVGLVLMVAVGFQEQTGTVAGPLSLAKILGFVLALAWLAAVLVGRPEERRARDFVAQYRWLTAALILFVAWAAVSTVWADRVGVAGTSVSRFALDFALFPIAFAALQRREHVVAVFVVFELAALLAIAYGLSSPADPTSAAGGRLGGAGLNPNDLGSLLVVGIVFGVTLAAVRAWPVILRALALSAAAGCAVGLYLTESRGALFFGFGAALVVAPMAAGRGRRATATLWVAVAVLGTAGWLMFASSPQAAHRLLHPEAAGGSGREDLWTVGLRIVEAHPFNGVGAGNFPVRSVEYLLRPGATQRDVYIVDQPKVPHNIYLNVLTELGLVGFALFLFILTVSLICALQAAQAFARKRDQPMELLSRGLFVALIALLAAGFFSSGLYYKELWLLLALAPALRALAFRRAASAGTPA